MDKNSNSYIFIYASVMVVLVAVILTGANLFLKPMQEKNKQDEKMIKLLSSIGVEATAENAQETYNEFLEKEIVIDTEGNILSIYADDSIISGTERAFNINLKSAMRAISKGEKAGIPLFIFQKDDKEFFVIPMIGKGLWGPISGNIALSSDKNTIVGINFDHESETPGLGAEIAAPHVEGKVVFSDQFFGKQIFDKEGNFTSVKVIKGGVANQSDVKPIHGVDAISGSTLTSNGVSHMLHDCLENYVNYFKNNN